jgi:hypothetical protein
MTREQINKRQREARAMNGNIHTLRYEKTPKGFLMRKYRNITSRVAGIQKRNFHLYKDVELKIDRDDFYEWSLSSLEFWKLYINWVKNNYCQKLTPSVDRIDSTKHYEFCNIEWVTNSENSRRGSLSNQRKRSLTIT